jgi:hypothetical protein
MSTAVPTVVCQPDCWKDRRIKIDLPEVVDRSTSTVARVTRPVNNLS